MKHLLLMIAAGFCCMMMNAKQYDVSSPSGVLKMAIESSDNLSYSLSVGGKVVMDDCVLSMTLADGRVLGNSPKVLKVNRKHVIEHIESPLYRQCSFNTAFNELSVKFKGGYTVELRAYDDGVAYRFVTDLKDSIEVENECVEFCFTDNYDMILPYADRRPDIYESSFESQYTMQKVGDKPFEDRLAFMPALVNINKDGWLLLTESDLISYPGAFLSSIDGKCGFKAVFPPVRITERETYSGSLRPDKCGEVIAAVAGTRTFPWRVVGYASTDQGLPLNNMVYALATPSKVEDTSWIKPGQSTWDWWNGARLYGVDFRAGNNTETYMYHIDFAAKYGIEYVMIDDGWYSFSDKDMLNPRADLDLPKLCAYASEKGVRIILWAVGHTLAKDADRICAHYASMGVAGFKVDFFDAQDQSVVDVLYDLAEATARHRMVIDFHGVYKPVGLSRTFPNILNYEGVYGLEQMKWTDRNKADMPLNDVLVPYIRMAAGALDYTPGAMLNASKNDFRSIDHMAMSQGTRAHQVALYIVYDSPLVMLCDTPSNYLKEDSCTRFITSIPEVADSTFVLDGKVGVFIVMARKQQDCWYVGGITSWEGRTYTLDCSFLDGGAWVAEIIKDGVNADRFGSDHVHLSDVAVTSESSLSLDMAPGGGFAVIFRKAPFL